MRIAVIGAGIAGACSSRLLAEAGHSVHVYEEQGVGGLVATYSPTLRLHAPSYSFLIRRTNLVESGYLPGLWVGRHAVSGKLLCQELLAYERIQVLCYAGIRKAWELALHYDRVVVSSRLDSPMNVFLGPLAYVDGFPVRDADSLQRYENYKYLYQRMGVIGVGSGAAYEMLSIDDVVQQALCLPQYIMGETHGEWDYVADSTLTRSLASVS